MKNLENNIENLLNTEPVYADLETENDEGFAKKIGRKLGGNSNNSALSEFGQKQNDMNSELIKALNDITDYCKKLEISLEKETDARHKTVTALSAIKKELDTVRLRSTLNSNQIEKMDGGLCKYTEKLENYTLSISPGARLADCPKGCKEADISDSIGYYERLEAAKQSESIFDNHDFEKFCFKAISRELSSLSAFDEVVINFYGDDRYAAVLYGNLNRNSIYKINHLDKSDTPEGHFSVLCTENAVIPKKLLLKSLLIIITGNNPFENMTAEEIDNLKFLNDCGLHSYLTISEQAYGVFETIGFRCVSLISADRLMNGKIVKAVEKNMESAVPSGALTLSGLKETLEGSGLNLISKPEDITEYNDQNKPKTFSDSCLEIIEKTALEAMEKQYFSNRSISKCLISETSDGIFNLINGINFVNHLDYNYRKKVYARVKTMLETNGLFVMNGFDSVTGIKLRAITGWEGYPVYEALWTREQLISELEENGFKIRFLIPAGTGLYDILPSKYRKSPVEWIIGVSI